MGLLCAMQGQVVKAVIVETKKQVQRRDGSTIKFDKNACVLVNAKGLPIGTRVLGFVTHELRARQLMKVLSLAARVF
jgi:large subunit ribosomal protein L14